MKLSQRQWGNPERIFDSFFVVSLNKLLNKQSELLVFWDAVILMQHHCNVITKNGRGTQLEKVNPLRPSNTYVSKILDIIGSGYGLMPVQHQVITPTIANWLLFWKLNNIHLKSN